MAEYTLYVVNGSCSFASHAALEHVGADYEAIPVDFQNEEQRSETYLAVNPKGRVPALVSKDGILTESPAILAYIAQKFPEANLAPVNDPWLFGQMQSFNAYLCATVHVAHAHRFRGYRWANHQSSFDDMQSKVPQTMTECFQLIEKEMFKGPWVLGDDFSVADFYLVTMSRWLEFDEVDTSLFPRVVDHRSRMHELASVQHVANTGG